MIQSKMNEAAIDLQPLNPVPRFGVCIGASTGGVIALQELLAALPVAFAASIVIVQHHPAGLTGVVVKQLARVTKLKVREACAADELARGVALVAPGDCLFALDTDGRVLLARDEMRETHLRFCQTVQRPSIDAAMRSVARVYQSGAIGIVLSGMGDDGARGAFEIKRRGGRILVQDTESCVVGSMPERTRLATTVDHVASVGELALLLQVYVSGGSKVESRNEKDRTE